MWKLKIDPNHICGEENYTNVIKGRLDVEEEVSELEDTAIVETSKMKPKEKVKRKWQEHKWAAGHLQVA